MAYGTINADVIGTSVAGSNLGAGNASIMKNRIINGAMVIDQRNAGASVTISGGQFPVDRFIGYNATDGVLTGQQSSAAPTGFNKSVVCTVTTADSSIASGQYAVFSQAIEGYNVADLNWGTANAKTVTLSFWVQSSLTGTFGGAIANSSNNRSYPFTYTISSANTWTQISVTITGDTTGTWDTANGKGMLVYWGLGVGSSYSGTAGSWAATTYLSATGAVPVISTLNATWYVTGVQLEVGSSATGYEYRQYGQELALCQRYAIPLQNLSASGAATSTTAAILQYSLPVTMRANPSLSTTSGNFIVYNGSANFTSTTAPTGAQFAQNAGTLLATGFSGLTSGQFLVNNFSTTQNNILSAEL